MIFLLKLLLQKIFSSKKTHILITLQNNNELRGGGGFITQLLDLELGQRKAQLHFRHDHNELRGKILITPPPELQKHLKTKHWFFRDSNLFGDFEKSATRMITSYNTIYPERQVEGIIAINYSFLETLLKIIGPVTVDQITFTNKNLFYQLSTIVSNVDFHNAEAGSNRKWILKKLFKKIVKTLLFQFWKWPQLITNFKQAIHHKNIQLYWANKDTHNQLISRQLAIPFTMEGYTDGLAIIENNYLGLKTNRYLRRIISREVDFSFDENKQKLSDANIKVTLAVTHAGGLDYPISGTYQGVINIHLPAHATNSKVITPGIPVEEKEENGYQIKSFYYLLPVGEKFTITLSYTLTAEHFTDNNYSFKYSKQSGAINEHIHERINFPECYELNTTAPELELKESKCFHDKTNINSDYQYTIHARLNNNPPRIFYHEITAPNLIDIRFNEAIHFLSTSPTNIKVTDKASGQQYKVARYEFRNENKWLYIHMQDLPITEEKFYQVEFTNLANKALAPLPKSREITIVYRSKLFKQ